MRALVMAVVVLGFAGFAGFAGAADEKIDAKKLIGKWEPAEAKGKGLAMVLEFADQGKLSLSVNFGGKAEKIEGAYKLEGNKLEVTMEFGGKKDSETITIVKLTDTELVTKDSKGKEDTLKRVGAKKDEKK